MAQVLASVREQPHLPHNQGKLNQLSYISHQIINCQIVN